LDQIKAGANILDVNVGPASSNPGRAMAWLVKTIEEVTDTQLALDSTRLEVIKSGLEAVSNPPMINSTQGDPERLAEYLPLALENDASLIALTMDARGVPQDTDRRVEIAGMIVMTAMEVGYPVEKLFIDPIIQPVKFAQTQVNFVLESISQILLLCDPAPHFVVGLSNVSQGTTERELINRTCLVMCMAIGLDAAIMDPFDKEMMDAMITAELLLNKQIYSDSFLAAYRSSMK
jgi:5-methyltetrahydrofolate corrinoid/iron sulfur protein methyltransferase